MKEMDRPQIFDPGKILNVEHLERVTDFLVKEINVPPIAVEVDMTNRCQSKCPRCAGGRENGADLENPQGVIKQLAEFGVKGVIMTGGGEPLLNPETPETVVLAKALGLDVAMVTNGLALNDTIDQILVNNTIGIRVSLDAASATDYEYTHGLPEGEFIKVVGNIAKLVEIRNKYGASDCLIGVGYLTDERTEKSMVEAAYLVKTLGADYIQFRPFHFDKTDIQSKLRECKMLEDGNFRVMSSAGKYQNMNNERDYSKCLGAQFTTVVDASGRVMLCCHNRGKDDFVLGDLKQQSIVEIWNGERRKQVMEKLDVSKCVPLCRNDGINRILNNMTKKRDHINFL